MLELPSSAHPHWDIVPRVPVKHPLSPKGTAGLRDSTCTPFWLCFRLCWKNERSEGRLPPPPPCWTEERDSSRKGSSRSKTTKRGDCCAVQRGVPGYHCGYRDSHLTLLLVWCSFWWCHWVWCIIHALPSFLTFSFAIRRELSNSQKGVPLISKGVCLYPHDGKPGEFIRRLK